MPKRHKRGRHQERRRRSEHNARARRSLRLALSKDPKNSRTGTGTFIDLNALGAALGRKWPIQPNFLIVIEQLQRVRDGREAEASLLTLDTEFISSTRRVLEVAVGEFHSGRVLLDVRGSPMHHRGTSEKKPGGRPMDQAERQVSFQSLRKVYGSRDQEKCSGKKTAREIAEMLKNAGVTQKSIILVWHTGPFDLTLLRELIGVRRISRRFASTRKLHPND